MNKKIYQLAGDLRIRYQKKINDTYIWSSIALEAIKLSCEDDTFLEKERFKVPSKRASKTKKITRTKEELFTILQTATEIDFNYAIFSYIVTQVEAFLYDLIYGILKIDTRRLKTHIQGIDHVKKIDVQNVLDADNINDLIDAVIKKELIGVFYASPEKQFLYLEKITGITFDDRLQKLTKKWKEYKATRDIIIHNSGIINNLYLEKSGEFSRWKIGDKIKIDDDYLNGLVAETKTMIGKICSFIQKI